MDRALTVPPSLLAYIAFTFVLVVTPGSTTAVVVRNTLIGGRAAGLAAASGAAVANTSHATAAGLGLAVVFARWPMALTVLRLVGAAYLAWLGLLSVHRGLRRRDGGLPLAGDSASGVPPRRDHSFRQGLAINLLSPVILSFYLVVVPSFLPSPAPPWYFPTMAAIHIAMAFLCHGAWAVALDRLQHAFQPPVARRMLEGATGLALIALAIRVFATS